MESIVLDPSEVADARTELDISNFIAGEGIDWGDAAIEAYMAEAERGQVPVGFRVPNRTVTIPFVLQTVGGTSFATIRASVQAKAALFQREGGWLKRVLSDGTSTVYLDIVNATLSLSGGWMQAHRDADIEATLTLEAIPDFYGAEVELSDHVETALPCLVFTEAAVGGDYPARVRLVVDEDDGNSHQRFLMYAAQSRNYSAAASAALFYEAEGLMTMGGAATAAGITGSSGGTVVRQGTLTPGYQAMLSTTSAEAVYTTHVGSFRVWARTHRPATNTGEVSVAFEWGEAGFRLRTTNTPVAYEAGGREGAYCLTDLGLVSLSKAAQGAQQWEGRVVAKSAVAGDSLDVDCLFIVPVDEGYGEVRGSMDLETPTAFVTRDEFNQGAGALAGKTMALAGGVSGPRSTGTVANDASYGSNAWTNPSNATASDGVYATVSLGVPSSQYLKATNFGFAIPAGATIDGIVAEVEKRGAASLRDTRVRIVKGGTVGATERANTTGTWSATDAYKTYGSASDLWGEAWTVADINSATFGVVFAANRVSGAGAQTASVDHIRITVYYTPSGGLAWSGAGDADDFTVETTGKTAQRTALADANNETGRYAISGVSAFSAQVVQAEVKSSTNGMMHLGVIARYVDTSNWLMATLHFKSSLSYEFLVRKRVAGTVTSLHLSGSASAALLLSTYYSIRLAVDAAGRWSAWWWLPGSEPGGAVAEGVDAVLATGGALASGKPGIYDVQANAISASTRNIDNFLAFVPTADAAVFASQSVEIRHDRVIREDSAGAVWTSVSEMKGDYLRLPPSGLEARPARIFVKASRNDPDTGTDTGVDDISAQAYVRPSWLIVPG